MTTPRQRQGRPVESVSLTVTFKATKEQAAELRKLVGLVSYEKGVCKIRMDTDTPMEAVPKVRALLEKVRSFT